MFRHNQRYFVRKEKRENIQPDMPSTSQDNSSSSEMGIDQAVSPTIVELLSPHIQINAMADYYDIPKLREFSNMQIQQTLIFHGHS